MAFYSTVLESHPKWLVSYGCSVSGGRAISVCSEPHAQHTSPAQCHSKDNVASSLAEQLLIIMDYLSTVKA